MAAVERHVVIVALAPAQPLDIAGPAEVLASVNVGRPGAYALRVVSPAARRSRRRRATRSPRRVRWRTSAARSTR